MKDEEDCSNILRGWLSGKTEIPLLVEVGPQEKDTMLVNLFPLLDLMAVIGATNADIARLDEVVSAISLCFEEEILAETGVSVAEYERFVAENLGMFRDTDERVSLAADFAERYLKPTPQPVPNKLQHHKSDRAGELED